MKIKGFFSTCFLCLIIAALIVVSEVSEVESSEDFTKQLLIQKQESLKTIKASLHEVKTLMHADEIYPHEIRLNGYHHFKKNTMDELVKVLKTVQYEVDILMCLDKKGKNCNVKSEESINQTTQTTPTAPTMLSRTSTSITLKSDSTMEYRRIGGGSGGGEWQDSNIFTNLSPSTSYTFTSRRRETATHDHSLESAAITFTTLAKHELTSDKSHRMVVTASSNTRVSVPTQTMNWGTSRTINLLQNYGDKDLTDGFEKMGRITQVSSAVRGTVTQSGNNAIYTGPDLFVGTDSFEATATDGLSNVTFTVNINLVNSPPVVSDREITILWSLHAAGFPIDLSTSASDPESNPLTFAVDPSSISPSGAGTVSLTAGSSSAIVRSGSSVYLGRFTFSFSASDRIISTPGTFGVTVINNMATPIPDSANIHWRQTGAQLNPIVKFASNLKDTDGDDLIIQSVIAQRGSVSIHESRTSIIYNAPSNTTGPDVVTYRFTDGAQSLEDSRTVINVNLFNNAPTALPRSASVKWNTNVPIDLNGACTDSDTWDSTFVNFNGEVSNIIDGSVSVSNSIVTFTPTLIASQYTNSGNVYNGSASFNFQCSDGLETAVTPGLVTISVTNNAPTGTGKTTTVYRNFTSTTYDFPWEDVATFTDLDGDSVSLIRFVSSDPTISVSSFGNALRLTTQRNVVGTKRFTFKLSDGLHESLNTLTFTVNFVNSPPVCRDASVTLTKRQVYNLSQLFSATDVNNDVLTHSLSGTVPSEFGSTFGNVFTAASGRSGTTSVNYVTSDGQLKSTPCTITITITNNAPNAPNATYSIQPVSNNLVHTFTYSGTDQDGDSLTYSSSSNNCVSASLATSLSISSSGTITFKRRSTSVDGTCTMKIVVSDNNNPSTSSSATITFTIKATPPNARDDRFQINQGQTIRIFTSQILANDNDEYGTSSTLTFVSFSCPDATYCHRVPRLLTINNQQVIEVDSDQRTCQADRFRYRMRTSLGAEREAIVFIEFKNCFCTAKIDFVFLYDSSGSIGTTNFNRMRDLGRRITGRMQLSNDAIKVSIVKYHTSAISVLKLTNNGTLVNSTFTNMSYDAGATATIGGLRVAVDMLRPANGGRPDADKVIYVLTDGLGNIPCTCSDCHWEWSRTPSIFQKTVQRDIINSLNGSARTDALIDLCRYKYDEPAVLKGTTCRNCSRLNPAYCLPCADSVPIAEKINSWKRDAQGIVKPDPDNPYNGNNRVQWKIVAMAVGNAMSNVWGARQIQGMNYDPSRAITVSWSDLSKTMNEIVDQSCNQVNVKVP